MLTRIYAHTCVCVRQWQQLFERGFKLMPDIEIKYVSCVLAEYLADGPKPCDEVKKHCLGLGITKSKLKIARKDLNVKTINTGNTWLWCVPDPGEGEDG